MNFEIPAGSFIGIVGSSGSGKSTMLKLLTRLFDPLEGTIRIDGYDIAKVDLYSLRSQVGVVPQDSLLFDGTVQANIALTNPMPASKRSPVLASGLRPRFHSGPAWGYSTSRGAWFSPVRWSTAADGHRANGAEAAQAACAR